MERERLTMAFMFLGAVKTNHIQQRKPKLFTLHPFTGRLPALGYRAGNSVPPSQKPQQRHVCARGTGARSPQSALRPDGIPPGSSLQGHSFPQPCSWQALAAVPSTTLSRKMLVVCAICQTSGCCPAARGEKNPGKGAGMGPPPTWASLQ